VSVPKGIKSQPCCPFLTIYGLRTFWKQALQLCSLELRRLHFDMFMCYRIIFGLVNVCVCVSFFELNCAPLTRGHPCKLYKPCTYNTARTSYFRIRIVNVWNSLPADGVDFSSFASFKRTVQQIDFTPFLLCSHT